VRGEKRREEGKGREVVRRNYVSGFEGSQAVPALPSHTNNVMGILCIEILSNIRRVTLGRIFQVSIVRLACEAYSVTWNLGTNSAFALGPCKTTENLARVGRSQDLLDAN
jgi:hypothetical protein